MAAVVGTAGAVVTSVDSHCARTSEKGCSSMRFCTKHVVSFMTL